MKRALHIPVALAALAATSFGCSSEGTDDVLSPSGSSSSRIGTVSSALSSTVEAVPSFGSNPGGLKLYAYVPKPLPASAPLVLVLHGCTQTAQDAAKWGWNELADKAGFVVGYPEQQSANNSVQCFNWGGEYGDLTNLKRDKGENLSIKQMADALVQAHGLDAKRVFIVGFSAGGASALISAATYPDVFAGVASLSGIPYACPASYSEVFSCQNPGVDRTADEWGKRVRDAFPGFGGAYPRATIWQGTADTTVGTKNRAQIVKQWTNVMGVTDTPSATDTVDGAKHATFTNGSGQVVVETYEVPGMTHGVPVLPGAQCGATSTFAFDKGICAAQRVAEFFGLTTMSQPLPGDGGVVTPGGDGGATAAPGPTTNGNGNGNGNAAGNAPAGNKAAGAGGDGAYGDRTPGSTCGVGVGSVGAHAAAFFGFGLAVASLYARRRRHSHSRQA